MNEDAYTGHIRPGKFILDQGVDPELDNLSRSEKLRLRGMGVYLDSPIPERLQREVAARHEPGIDWQSAYEELYLSHLDMIKDRDKWWFRAMVAAAIISGLIAAALIGLWLRMN